MERAHFSTAVIACKHGGRRRDRRSPLSSYHSIVKGLTLQSTNKEQGCCKSIMKHARISKTSSGDGKEKNVLQTEQPPSHTYSRIWAQSSNLTDLRRALLDQTQGSLPSPAAHLMQCPGQILLGVPEICRHEDGSPSTMICPQPLVL